MTSATHGPLPTSTKQSEVKSRRHIAALDGVRGLAVLIVVFAHTVGGAKSSNLLLRAIGNAVKAGWSGVTLFFILSGFLITGILWDTKGRAHWWRNFYMRRVLRIAPLYYGSLLLILLVALAQSRLRSGSQGLWVFVFYLQDIYWINDAGAHTRPLTLDHFWSLAVEEQFYLVWPLLLSRLSTAVPAKRLCLGIFFASMAFRYCVWEFTAMGPHLTGFILCRAGELALGGYLAICFRDGSWKALEKVAGWVGGATLAGFIVLALATRTLDIGSSRSMGTVGLALVSVFLAALIVLAIKGGTIQRAMNMAWLRWIGTISYGIYVFHVLLLPFFTWLGDRLAPHAGRVEEIVIRAVIIWILSPLIAWISYRWFEQPILRLRRYFHA